MPKKQSRYQALSFVLLLCCTFFLNACGSKNFMRPTATEKVNKQATTQGEIIAETATSQIGKYYRLGGKSPKTGFDCSGLIWWAYDKHGIEVPRITTQQAKAGKKIASNKAEPGDILVFYSRYSSSRLHTGIYLGDNKFVHSPRKGAKVRIESINEYWKPRLRGVRRIIE